MIKTQTIRISTEGVLVLASAKRLKEEYTGIEFDYDFPEGLNKLLNERTIIALLTSAGDDLVINVNLDDSKTNRVYEKEIEQFIIMEEEDSLLILNHANFTLICDTCNGDFQKFGWPIQKIDNLEPGAYYLMIGVEDFTQRIEEIDASFRLTIDIEKTSDFVIGSNQVLEISF